MTDYYFILGIQKSANLIEIKAAFRRLAKLYHPDKNPNNKDAKLLFENILIAYEVLSNPHKKRRYDDLNSVKKNTQQQSQNKGKPYQKAYSATPEELKQRQYYQTYYKTAQKKQAENNVNRYSDYKYILFATPIAVGLLFLVVSIFSSELKQQNNLINTKPNAKSTATFLLNGNKPYSLFYGNDKTFATVNSLKINNSSSYDAIILVFSIKTNEYIQHAYVQTNNFVEFYFLPNEGVFLKSFLGFSWNKNKLILNTQIVGTFDTIVQYQNWQNKPIYFSENKFERVQILNIIDLNSDDKNSICSQNDFFKK